MLKRRSSGKARTSRRAAVRRSPKRRTYKGTDAAREEKIQYAENELLQLNEKLKYAENELLQLNEKLKDAELPLNVDRQLDLQCTDWVIFTFNNPDLGTLPTVHPQQAKNIMEHLVGGTILFGNDGEPGHEYKLQYVAVHEFPMVKMIRSDKSLSFFCHPSVGPRVTEFFTEGTNNVPNTDARSPVRGMRHLLPEL